jgi:HAD domain in Swiss Army Knife RNA repair proteins
MTRVIFQDIDGPLIPMRMYYRGNRPHNGQSFLYDPIAVDMLKVLCEKFDAKVVFNTLHNENPANIMLFQARTNNMLDFMLTQDPITSFADLQVGRLHAINQWLTRHPEVTEWVVIDDADIDTDRLVQVDFHNGMTINTFVSVCEKFGEIVAPFAAINGVLSHGK